MSQKVIRDPVYNHIYFDKNEDKLILDLLACPEVQRLRRVRQLGMSYLTYPGAEHSRFSHALGAAHLMKTALRYLKENEVVDVQIDEQTRLTALAASLLHDIGHGPFSHVLERQSGVRHERITAALIMDDRTQVNQTLRNVDRALPARINQVLCA
jgi:uncharacterized protein